MFIVFFFGADTVRYAAKANTSEIPMDADTDWYVPIHWSKYLLTIDQYISDGEIYSGVELTS